MSEPLKERAQRFRDEGAQDVASILDTLDEAVARIAELDNELRLVRGQWEASERLLQGASERVRDQTGTIRELLRLFGEMGTALPKVKP